MLLTNLNGQHTPANIRGRIMFTDILFSRLKLIALPLATSLFVLSAPLANADDIFVKIDGIKGESRIDRFEEMIQAVSWNWGLDQSASLALASRTGAKVTVHKLTFTHRLDMATPRLMQFCATGRHLKEAFLYLRRPGKSAAPYVVIKLTDVVVSNVALVGGSSSEPTMEEVSLSFGKYQFSYQPEDEAGMARGEAIQTGWDLAANRPL